LLQSQQAYSAVVSDETQAAAHGPAQSLGTSGQPMMTEISRMFLVELEEDAVWLAEVLKFQWLQTAGTALRPAVPVPDHIY